MPEAHPNALSNVLVLRCEACGQALHDIEQEPQP